MRRAASTLLLCSLITCAFSQEHARILESTTTYTLVDSYIATVEEMERIEIKNEAGKRLAVFQEYIDRFRKIDDVTIEVFDTKGKRLKKLRKPDGHEIGFKASYEVSDGKIFILDPEFQNYPYTIEITSKVKLNGYVSLPTWVPRSQFHVSVAHASLIVKYPENMDVRFREENIKGTTRTSEEGVETIYEVVNLDPIDKKTSYRDFYEIQPKVFISPLKFSLDNSPGNIASWKEFGDWFYELNDVPSELLPKTKRFIDSLDKTNRDALVRNLYKYMQDRTRYVSIQLGIGGFKSLPTEDVEKYGYGDCKALSTYMKNMLNYAGVKSNYVLVRAGRDVPDVIADFPSNQFNHVFLAIPVERDTLLMECTSQTAPSNFIGTFTDDRNVLWIDHHNSKIIRSRVYNHIDNHQTNTALISLDDKGNATAELNFNQTGVFFDELMLFTMAPKDYLMNYNINKFNYKDFSITDFSFQQPNRDLPILNTTYKIQIQGLGKMAGGKMVLPIVQGVPFNKYIEKDDLQKFYSIKRAFTTEDNIEVTLPENYWIYNLPEPQEVISRFGRYTLRMEFESGNLKVHRSLVVYKGYYNKDRYQEFKEFYQKIEALEGKKLVLNSKT